MKTTSDGTQRGVTLIEAGIVLAVTGHRRHRGRARPAAA